MKTVTPLEAVAPFTTARVYHCDDPGSSHFGASDAVAHPYRFETLGLAVATADRFMRQNPHGEVAVTDAYGRRVVEPPPVDAVRVQELRDDFYF